MHLCIRKRDETHHPKILRKQKNPINPISIEKLNPKFKKTKNKFYPIILKKTQKGSTIQNKNH